MTSCVPSGTNSGRKKSTEASSETSGGSNETSDPTFDNQSNFFQNGSTQSSSYLEIPLSFADTFYFRGTGVSSYIKSFSPNQPQCFVFSFPSTTTSNVLVLAARPFNFINYTTKQKEYYYLLEPAATTNNRTFCQKVGVLNKINSLYPTSTPVYDFASICPGCLNSFFTTAVSKFMTDAGNSIDLIQLDGLGLKIQRIGGGTDSGIGGSCSTDDQCSSDGYDCCSGGQCVNDKQLKNGVDTSSTEYLYAQGQIALNPSNIINFTEFYHLCTNTVPTDPNPTDPGDAEYEANKYFKEQKELYDCTTQIKGELSICTKEFSNATASGLGATFLTEVDDRTFLDTYTGTKTLQDHSLWEVIHGDETIFTRTALNTTAVFSTSDLVIGVTPTFNGNDTLSDPLQVTLNNALTSSSQEDLLKLRYQIDGSCLQVTSGYAKCTKHYTQGQNDGFIDDHYPGSNNFLIPMYADITRSIAVTVDDAPRLISSSWQLVPSSPSYIQFVGTGTQVYDTQVVKITFYVSTTLHPTLMTSKNVALQNIADRCQCPDKSCRLKESFTIVNGVETVTGYECFTPQSNDDDIPSTQSISVSAQNTPVRFFTTQGSPAEAPTYGDANTNQEGNTFEYTNNDLLRPNNVSTYVGFNEIYGSITTNGGSARAAKQVKVEFNKTYDLTVYSGTFSTCLFCGTDYYSNLVKMFPANFTGKGGGYTPDTTATDVFTASTLKADDLQFGRACFLPVSMIPWSHAINSDRQLQRLNRLSTQHFLFANGYRSDWYGFDYGSLIGSWDGITWFSIGNQRRTTSKSSTLYLAINAYFGDLTIDTTFSVKVTKASNLAGSGSNILTDYQSDGAQCQQQHACEADNDCASRLGWDYVCASVTSLESTWPNVDTNGLEIPGADAVKRILNIGGVYSGPQKRCVYRGKGAPCATDYTPANSSGTFNGTADPKLLGCSANNYCQVFKSATFEAKFNNKIARFAKPVIQQNSSSNVAESDLDTVGLGARILGRPYAYKGEETINTTAYNNLISNNVFGICVSGRSPEVDTISDQNTNVPAIDYIGDKVTGNGMTLQGIGPHSGYVSSCSNFDDSGNYIHFNDDHTSKSNTDASIIQFAASQSIPTNSTDILEGFLGSNKTSALTVNFTNEFVTTKKLESNRCLRAPGSTCHTNLDCAPSKLITDITKSINISSHTADLNEYEIKFWQETLVCSQETAKTDVNYDVANNRCCREIGKIITVATDESVNAGTQIVDVESIPGIDISLDEPKRYTRNVTSHYQKSTSSTIYPPMKTAGKDACAGTCAPDIPSKQFNTLMDTATRTCCSGNWIRNFHSTNGGGGHVWDPTKLQKFKKESFQCLNWIHSASNDPGGECLGPTTQDDCNIRSISDIEAKPIFDWLSTMELTGIPQIAIKANHSTRTELHCKVQPGNPSLSASSVIIPNVINTAGEKEYDGIGGAEYYSASDSSNFDSSMKTVFSPDELSCCMPLNTTMATGADPTQCCSGHISPTSNKCALKNYSNLNVYFNKYVSSEAKDVADNLFDENTGFLKSREVVHQLACQSNACESGVVAYGLAHTSLKFPGHEDKVDRVKRFLDGNDEANDFSGKASLFDDGLKWNTNVYCVPLDLASTIDPDSGIQVFQCGN